jgi:hypothetical protein
MEYICERSSSPRCSLKPQKLLHPGLGQKGCFLHLISDLGVYFLRGMFVQYAKMFEDLNLPLGC